MNKKRESYLMASDIHCCDEFEIFPEYISVLWESTLNIEQYFGLLLSPNEYVQFETKYYFDGSISAEYTILAESPNDFEVFIDSKEWDLTPNEKDFLFSKMNEHCLLEHGCPIEEYISILMQIRR